MASSFGQNAYPLGPGHQDFIPTDQIFELVHETGNSAALSRLLQPALRKVHAAAAEAHVLHIIRAPVSDSKRSRIFRAHERRTSTEFRALPCPAMRKPTRDALFWSRVSSAVDHRVFGAFRHLKASKFFDSQRISPVIGQRQK